jgi:hypothetical protein
MMTPEAAGAALAADPTFRLMSREEQEEEAARLLGGFNTPSDDPLDVALAIELAEAGEFAETLQRERDAIHAAEAGLEPCRLNGGDGPPCGGAEPIAGNGRCMTCGAQRRAASAPETAVEAQQAAAAPTPAPAPETRPAAASAPILRHGVTNDPGASLIGRFKEATGATDREVSGMLGMSRATAQAYASGRLPEKLDTAQARTLIDDLAERLLLLADLKRDLAAAIGEID